ncbi:MAG: sugar-binding domain-containing protein [Phocaeicola sp.]
MRTFFYYLIMGGIALFSINDVLVAQEVQSLAGEWNFSLDEADKGIDENWANRELPLKIKLPGTTDQAKYGEASVGSDFGILTREYKYIGPAWYSRKIEIPHAWSGKEIVLELERVLWESRIYLDGKEISMQDALSTPHSHNLGRLTAGTHHLAIRVNNEMIYNIGDKGHVYTEYTQSIWNGIVGKIEIRPLSAVRFSNPQVYTSTQNGVELKAVDTLFNTTSREMNAEIVWTLKERGVETTHFTKREPLKVVKGENPIEFSAVMPADTKLWCDVNPNLYVLTASIVEKGKIIDSRTIEFGFREITHSNSKILVNNKPVFLRGNLDCVHFPLTGYPSCEVEEWERIFRIYKEYGLNHVRFHSWCPPAAAFTAADRLGIYIQAETIWIDWWMGIEQPSRPDMLTKGLPQGLGKNPSADRYVQLELERMLRVYGNHASFVMQCIGNELGNSDFEVMESWIKPLKERDSRRLYSVSTARKIMPTDQYMATHYIDKLGSTRGLRGGASTAWDFEDVYSKATIPILSHEIGQWPVYPKWSEIKKYKGVLKARNFEEFYETAKANKIEKQNADFVAASGALNQIMYKYEIESFLRTPSCAGIQLLSMQDYQGQGEALIGWLDVFYDSKGITTPEQFKMHHDTIVPLLRVKKFVWSNEEQFEAGVQLAHHGTHPISDVLCWSIQDELLNEIASGEFPPSFHQISTSDLVGEIRCNLSAVKKATQLTVNLSLKNREVLNAWSIWVYPVHKNERKEDRLLMANRFDKSVIDALERGEKVLLDASALGDETTCDKLSFYPLYWSLTFFPGQSKNTIGLVVRDKHPVFNQFPTESHSNWQWEAIYKGARAFYINEFAENYKPMAQPVDDFHRNNKLASIFELKVGKGKLLVTGYNLSEQTNLVAQQLKKSIIHYMESEDFQPTYELDRGSLQKMFRYVEPLKSSAPVGFENSLLYVERERESQAELKKGVTYHLKEGWSGEEVDLQITPPAGMIGSLHVCFDSVDKKAGVVKIYFEGRDYELKQNKEGESWVTLHVMREDSNDKLLKFRAKGVDSTISVTKIALLEGE